MIDTTDRNAPAWRTRWSGACRTSPELTAGLRKLLEAKDCFVRSVIALNKTG